MKPYGEANVFILRQKIGWHDSYNYTYKYTYRYDIQVRKVKFIFCKISTQKKLWGSG